MPESLVRPGKKMSFVERRIRRILNARSVTFGLALTFVGLSLVGGIVIRFVDHENFPSIGLGIWWALQTVTTVGYGDVTPKEPSGRIIAAFVMLQGIAFLAITTAAITSTFVARASKERERARDADEDDAELRIEAKLVGIDQRLDRLEKLLQAREPGIG